MFSDFYACPDVNILTKAPPLRRQSPFCPSAFELIPHCSTYIYSISPTYSSLDIPSSSLVVWWLLVGESAIALPVGRLTLNFHPNTVRLLIRLTTPSTYGLWPLLSLHTWSRGSRPDKVPPPRHQPPLWPLTVDFSLTSPQLLMQSSQYACFWGRRDS